MEKTDKYAIEIKNLTKKFGDFTAVNDISMKIEKGKIVAFIGPNGSGKSTTLRIICGVLSPTGGQVIVNGFDVSKDIEAVRLSLGYMSQAFSLYEDLTVNENLNFYASIYGLNKKEIEERKTFLIKVAGLQGKENHLSGILSGGYKQRLALSCAILHKPSLLILDEPTAGIDPVSRRIFWQVIRNLVKNDGTSVLITTHYMDEAETCDSCSFILNGEILTIGKPTELMEKENLKKLEDVFIRYMERELGQSIDLDFEDKSL